MPRRSRAQRRPRRHREREQAAHPVLLTTHGPLQVSITSVHYKCPSQVSAHYKCPLHSTDAFTLIVNTNTNILTAVAARLPLQEGASPPSSLSHVRNMLHPRRRALRTTAFAGLTRSYQRVRGEYRSLIRSNKLCEIKKK